MLITTTAGGGAASGPANAQRVNLPKLKDVERNSAVLQASNSKNPKAAALVLRKYGSALTAGQTRLLNQARAAADIRPDKKSTAIATTKTVDARSAKAFVRERVMEVLRDLSSSYPLLRQMLTSPDPRASPEYRSWWVSHGCPFDAPAPLPVANAPRDGRRYAYCSGGTVPMLVTVAAGETTLICAQPNRSIGPLMAYTTTGGGAVGVPNTAVAWTHTAFITDGTVGAPSQTSDWIHQAPWYPFINADSVKNALTGEFHTTGNESTQCEVQLLGSIMDVQVGIPYNGQCTTTVLGPGSNPQHLGPGASVSLFPYDAQVSGHTNRHDPTTTGSARLPTGIPGMSSPVQVAHTFGQMTNQFGGSRTATLHSTIVGDGHTGFTRPGIIDALDAPAAGYNSATFNNFPRLNIQNTLNNGWCLIENTGSTNVTATVYYHAVYAVLVEYDANDTDFEFTSSLMRQSCACLTHHPPSKVPITPPVVANNREDQIRAHAERASNQFGTPAAVAKATSQMAHERGHQPIVSTTPSLGDGLHGRVEAGVNSALGIMGTVDKIAKMTGIEKGVAAVASTAWDWISTIGAGLLAL